MIVLKLIGVAVLCAAAVLAVAVYDLGWNGGALSYRLLGRDTLIASCTPPLRADLVGRGFSPVDLEFGDAPSISSVAGLLGQSRRFSGSFTFFDGNGGPRIDGQLLCTVRGSAVNVELDLDQLPRRVT